MHFAPPQILHYRVRILTIAPPDGRLSPSSRRAAALTNGPADAADADAVPEPTPASAADSSTTSSIVVVPDELSSDGETRTAAAEPPQRAPSSATSSASFEHVQHVRIGELPTVAVVTAISTPFRREFDSPLLVARAANLVPKPPRHSLERGAELLKSAPIADDESSDEGAEEVRLLGGNELAAVDAVPLLPTTPLPKDDKSIEFAKTNVN